MAERRYSISQASRLVGVEKHVLRVKKDAGWRAGIGSQ